MEEKINEGIVAEVTIKKPQKVWVTLQSNCST